MHASSFSATVGGRSPRSAGSRIPPMSATQQLPSSASSASFLSSTMTLTPAESAPAALASAIPPLGSLQSLTPLSASFSPSQASPRRIPPLLNPKPSLGSAQYAVTMQQQQQQPYSAFASTASSVSPRSGRLAPLTASPLPDTLSTRPLSATFSPFAVAQLSLQPSQLPAPLQATSFPSHFPLPAPLPSYSPLTPPAHPYASNSPLPALQSGYSMPPPPLAPNPFASTLPFQPQPALPRPPSTYIAPTTTLTPPIATLRSLPDIASLLASCARPQYVPSFYQTGYTDMGGLLSMPAERWQAVLDAVTKDMLVRLGRGEVADEQLQFGHRQLIVAALQREKDFFFGNSPRPFSASSSPYPMMPPLTASVAAAPTSLPAVKADGTADGEAKPAEDAVKPTETTASPPSLPSEHHGHLATIMRHWCCSFTIGAVFLLFSGALFLLWQELQVAPSASTTTAAPQHAVTGFNFLKALCVIGFVVGGLLVLAAMRLFHKYPEHRRCGEWCGECCAPSEPGCCAQSECCTKWRNWCTVCCANLPCDTCCASCRACCAADPAAPGCCDALCKADPNAVSCCDKLTDAWTCLWKGALAAVIGLWSFVCCTTPSASCCAPSESSTCCSLSALCAASSAPFSCRQCMHDWGCGGLCCDEDGTDECCAPCRAACTHSECCAGGCWHGCQQSTCYKIVCCQCKISVQ